MTSANSNFHGSDIDAVANTFHLDKGQLVSFAANVNPLGLSPKMEDYLLSHLDVICSYPERDYHSLTQAISTYCHAPANDIVVGQGVTELISNCVISIHPKKCLLLAPSYSEYEREIGLLQSEVSYYFLEQTTDFRLHLASFLDALTSDLDLVIICNPNNPTGTALTTHEIEQIAKKCQTNGTTLMVDETYIEFSKRQTELEAISLTHSYPNLIVLRGVSKFFAAPGLRLGYAVLHNQEQKDSMMIAKNPWGINSIAEAAGQIMFFDKDYIDKTKNFILSEGERLQKLLKEFTSFKVYATDSNFFLIKLLHTSISSKDIFAHCAKQGLMLRDCSTFQGLDTSFIRICVMDKEQNNRLIQALHQILS